MDECPPQVQFLLLSSLDHDMPAYFRILPGSINSVAFLRSTMDETWKRNMVLVADTGFYFRSNAEALSGMGIHFIIPPLKGNSKLIDYTITMNRYFMFQDHPIFYARHAAGGYTMFTCRDGCL